MSGTESPPEGTKTKGTDVSAYAGPEVPRDKEKDKTSILARLRQATWEATQYLSYDEIHEYVEAVLREVESDLP